MTIDFIIEGVKWFDKINGNTYHAVNITNAKTNKLIFSSGLTYGYGDAWQHTAIGALIELGLWTEQDRFNHELKREHLFFTCRDGLKKELKKIEVET